MPKLETNSVLQAKDVHIVLSPELYDDFRVIAFYFNRKLTDIAREALEAYIPKLKKKHSTEIENMKEILRKKM